MPGPNSAPNGDTTIVRGHMNEEFMCEIHVDKHLDKCYAWMKMWPGQDIPRCMVVPKREWLSKRNRLETGKTK